MKKCLKILNLALLLGPLACSSSTPVKPATSISTEEQDAIYAIQLQMSEEATYALETALKKYQSLDDLAGQWRIRYLKAAFAFAAEDLSEAAAQADVLEEIAEQLNSPTIKFKTYLVLARSRDDRQHYYDALKVASSAIEKAVVHAYLGETRLAVELLEGVDSNSPGDRGFVYYQHAMATGSPTYFQLSLSAYKSAQDSRGVADSLVSLARIEVGKDRIYQAKTYARRAVRVLEAAGDDEKAKKIDTWISTL